VVEDGTCKREVVGSKASNREVSSGWLTGVGLLGIKKVLLFFLEFFDC
jgi:hypothetical protein